jgi:hypothetical protein
MAGQFCEREGDLQRMVRSRTVDEELRAHTSACEACRETLTVALWMQQMAATSVAAASLPDPAYLWYKAQLLRRWDAERQVLEPIEFWKRVQVLVALAAAAVVLVWLWDKVPAAAIARAGDQVMPWVGVMGTMVPVFVLSGALLAASAFVVVYDWFVKE